jgi:hypothetical protein
MTPIARGEDGLTQPGTRLTWHPVRPERDDAAGAADKAPTEAKQKEANAADYASVDRETQLVHADKAVQQCSGEECEKAPQKLHSVVTAHCIDGNCDNPTAASNKVRLAAGQSTATSSSTTSSTGKTSKGNLALTDPFGDNMPSVRSRRLAMTPPDEINSLPVPNRMAAPNQNAASPMRIEQTAQDPAELTAPPEPLRHGLPKKTVQVQLPEPPAPAPDLFPNANPDKLPLRNPEEACKEEYDHIKAVKLQKLSIDIVPPGADAKGDQVPFECGLSTDQFEPRCWPHLTYTWKASALCHKPLYFEEVGLERYGHSWGPCGLEDAQSFVHFFGDLVLLPYNVGVQTPCECDYALGYYRPGDCAPWICDPFPLSCRGVMTGAVGYCAFAALFP